MGRATQGVRLINLTKKNDVIASVCKVMSSDLEAVAEEESRNDFDKTSEEIMKNNTASVETDEAVADEGSDNNPDSFTEE